jgi:hypothetical protein
LQGGELLDAFVTLAEGMRGQLDGTPAAFLAAATARADDAESNLRAFDHRAAAHLLLNNDPPFPHSPPKKLTHTDRLAEFVRDATLSWLDVRLRALRSYANHARKLNEQTQAPLPSSFGGPKGALAGRMHMVDARVHGGNLRHDVMLLMSGFCAARHPGQQLLVDGREPFQVFAENAFRYMYKMGVRAAGWLSEFEFSLLGYVFCGI